MHTRRAECHDSPARARSDQVIVRNKCLQISIRPSLQQYLSTRKCQLLYDYVLSRSLDRRRNGELLDEVLCGSRGELEVSKDEECGAELHSRYALTIREAF